MSIIKRQILFPGKQDLGKLEPDTKLLYHFETVVIRKGQEPLVIDDSRRMAKGQPVETIYGKQFKLPVWESCLTSMRKGEICKLTVRDDPITHYICLNYVVTSKCFRKFYGVKPTNRHDSGDHHHHNHEEPHHSSGHNCSMSIKDSPYKDLNQLIANQPEIFEFTFELVDAIPPKSYTKDIWQMSDDEKLSMLPKFREDGNKYYSECDYEKAVSFYTKGLSAIESLMMKEKPGDGEWKKLAELKKPFLLNLAQVKLNQCEFYECIKFTDEVLKCDPENIKALFRRAKAHAGVWNIDDAREDLKKCVEYDGAMTKTVGKYFQELKQREEIKNKEDRERFVMQRNMYQKSDQRYLIFEELLEDIKKSTKKDVSIYASLDAKSEDLKKETRETSTELSLALNLIKRTEICLQSEELQAAINLLSLKEKLSKLVEVKRNSSVEAIRIKQQMAAVKDDLKEKVACLTSEIEDLKFKNKVIQEKINDSTNIPLICRLMKSVD